MLISEEWFVIFIVIAVAFPIISVITLFMVIGYEKEFRLIKQHAELEKEFQQSKYIQLNTQIQPHFLFNTINLILGYARIDEKERLIKAIENLSMYLKYNYQIQDQLIPLFTELKYTKNYLEIQQSRYDSSLNIVYDIDPDINDALVPPYILHTLTENAFKHGLEKKVGEKKLWIILRKEDRKLVIQVLDNGAGLNVTEIGNSSAPSYGLKNIKNRLILLFGNQNIELTLIPIETGGTKASVKFPIVKE